MDYRREIDGLRALAVLPVMLSMPDLTRSAAGSWRGCVLCDRRLLDYYHHPCELAKERLSIIEFYERRARRILASVIPRNGLHSVRLDLVGAKRYGPVLARSNSAEAAVELPPKSPIQAISLDSVRQARKSL